MREFRGKTAVVTGAASGMGRAFATRYAKEGMRVVMADIEAPALEAAANVLRDAGHDVLPVVCDVSKLEAVEALARQAVEAYGGVHVVSNNAGVEGYLDGAIWEATDKDWAWTFGVNFWGPVNVMRTFLPLMLASGEEGHMVNTASTTGLVMGNNMYGITKHAVVAMTETAYQELKRRDAKVGISVLCPGLVDTRLFEGSRNRPAELRNDPSAPLPEPRRILQGAMPPSQVADIVLQAIRDEQFYILTDRDWDERMKTRLDNVLNRRNPEVAPGLGR